MLILPHVLLGGHTAREVDEFCLSQRWMSQRFGSEIIFITEIFAKKHKDIMVPLQCDRCVEGDGVIIAKCQIVEVNNNIEYVTTYR